MTLEDFIAKAKLKFGNKFDYSQAVYTNIKNKIKIICPVHGLLLQTAESHLASKHGCPKCSKTIIGALQNKKAKETFVEKSKSIHGERYDYKDTNYISNNKNVTIICKIHGPFFQQPSNHLQGKGCPKCKLDILRKRFQMPLDIFIKRAKGKYGEKYDYSEVEYVNCQTNVKIKCCLHNKYFYQTPYTHLNSDYGCYECAVKGRSITHRRTPKEIESICRNKHGDKYSYIFPENQPLWMTKIQVVCPDHGDSYQTVNNHINGCGCPKCAFNETNIEKFIKLFLTKNNIPFIINDRKEIDGKEIDFYIPNLKLGIECHGIYWHSENCGKDKKYHLSKLETANRNGIDLIQIFENEINDKPLIVLSRIKHKLKLVKRSIYARQCNIMEIDTNLKNKFLEKYHLQGCGSSSINFGLFYKSKLVSVMTFSKLRKALGQIAKDRFYELSRFASIFNFNIVGGASKLFKYFERTYKPKQVISYADRRWSNGDLYYKLGFKLDHLSKPNYWYFFNDATELYHRFNFRKQVLKDKLKIFDEKLSEWLNMKNNGYNRIWDCGNLVFVKKYD